MFYLCLRIFLHCFPKQRMLKSSVPHAKEKGIAKTLSIDHRLKITNNQQTEIVTTRRQDELHRITKYKNIHSKNYYCFMEYTSLLHTTVP